MHFLQDKHQGIRTCLRGLYEEVCNKNPPHDFVFVFFEPGEESEYWKRYGEVSFVGRQRRAGRLAYGMGSAIRKLGRVDLTHFSAVVPARIPGKVMVTIHDILFLTHPAYFDWKYRCKQRLALKWTLHRADVITAVSDYTRRTLAGIQGEKVAPVKLLANGIDSKATSSNKTVSRKFVKARYGLDNYFLTVGRIDPRKNHRNMLKAYEMLARNTAADELPTFVIVGNLDNHYVEGADLINRCAEGLPVVWLKNVDNETLRHLYAAAIWTVMASHAEGFGLPVLESMAAATPVIGADNTAVPEVLGNSGVLVDSTDPAAIAGAYSSILTDSNLRKSCSARGYERACAMSWDRCAEDYLALLDGMR